MSDRGRKFWFPDFQIFFSNVELLNDKNWLKLSQVFESCVKIRSIIASQNKHFK